MLGEGILILLSHVLLVVTLELQFCTLMCFSRSCIVSAACQLLNMNPFFNMVVPR